jgi:hypothetical protein
MQEIPFQNSNYWREHASRESGIAARPSAFTAAKEEGTDFKVSKHDRMLPRSSSSSGWSRTKFEIRAECMIRELSH